MRLMHGTEPWAALLHGGLVQRYGRTVAYSCYSISAPSTPMWVFIDLHLSPSPREGAALTTLQMIAHSRKETLQGSPEQ